MLNNTLKIAATLLIFFGAGAALTQLLDYNWSLQIHKLFSSSVLYVTPDIDLRDRLNKSERIQIGWRNLLPNSDQSVLAKYQSNNEKSLSEQVALSIKSSTDQAYQSALYSTDVVEQIIGQHVSISGYIVPIDLNEDRSVKRFFLVPYYGACIHYPPPPPNQMIYVDLIDGFSKIMMSQAFTLTGVLEKGLFEDHQGTSAYKLNLSEIKEFHEQPDEYRNH
ncbi:DUF3299 domain-containing protein [Paraglaciecola sp. L1A13]|uniref:DUF3299 domain-containing protein n=1 Tax=Paraglaciecola sp. L1A13 TaxID=2686359 RepID=UPI00131C2D42|nr:DUF3299 domain-containing protein [Paraglaciecola sp. L1A13]|tara:strand:+ start:4236 stop:4898 length:663 start_codon:yes stop_codon:yes gene_type:complete